MKPQTLNVQAEQLFSQGNAQDALSTFQQVFLSHGKSDGAATQIEVARALCGAYFCLQAQNQGDKAAQILATLERRCKQSPNQRAQSYLALAAAGRADAYAQSLVAPAPSFDLLKGDAGALDEADSDDELEVGFDFESIEAQLARAHEAESPAAFEEASSARNSKIVAEEHVSLARIERLLEDAFFSCEVTPNEAVCVVTDGPKILIDINGKNRLLHFCALYGVRKYADLQDKLALVNKLNDNYILIRASLSDEMTLTIDCYLPFNGGVAPLHIVTLLRLMARIIPAALSESDPDEILT